MKKKSLLGFMLISFLIAFSFSTYNASAQVSGKRAKFKRSACISKKKVGMMCLWPGRECSLYGVHCFDNRR